MARFIISNNEDVADLFPAISPEEAGDVLDIETDMDFSYAVPSVHTYVALVSSETEITQEGIHAALEKWNEDAEAGWYEDGSGNRHKTSVLRYQILVTSDIKNIGVNRSRLDVMGLRLIIERRNGVEETSSVQIVPYTDHASFMDYSRLPSDLMPSYGVVGRIGYHQNHTPVISTSRTIDRNFGGVILLQFSHTVDVVEFHGFMKKDVDSETEPKTCVYDVRSNDDNVFVGYMKDDTEEEFKSLTKYGSLSMIGSCGLVLWNEEEQEPEPVPEP